LIEKESTVSVNNGKVLHWEVPGIMEASSRHAAHPQKGGLEGAPAWNID